MLAIKAEFDGKQIVLPKVPDVSAGTVIVVFEHADVPDNDHDRWLKAQEAAFSKVWDNEDDAVYDTI